MVSLRGSLSSAAKNIPCIAEFAVSSVKAAFMISTNNKIRNENPASTGSLAGSKRIFLHSICSTLLPEMKANNKAVTRIFFGGCHVELERRRREYRRAVGTEGVWSGEGMSPPQKILAFFISK